MTLYVLGAVTFAVVAVVDFVHGNYLTSATFVLLAGALVALDSRSRKKPS